MYMVMPVWSERKVFFCNKSCYQEHASRRAHYLSRVGTEAGEADNTARREAQRAS